MMYNHIIDLMRLHKRSNSNLVNMICNDSVIEFLILLVTVYSNNRTQSYLRH